MNKTMKIFFLAITLLLSFMTFGYCQISIPKIFSSNMVLQRDVDIPFRGAAPPGSMVTVTIGNQKFKGKSDHNGRWRIVTPPHIQGGPIDIILSSGTDSIVLRNVLYGDVWVCGGQSNMEWKVKGAKNAEEEIAHANYPKIRLFEVGRNMANKPQDDVISGQWEVCTPKNIAQFSAIGYFYGRDLQSELNIPIGLLSSNYGGTIAEAWTSREGLYPIECFREGLEKLPKIDFEQEKINGDAEFSKWISQYYKKDRGYNDGKYVWADPETNVEDWGEITLPGIWEGSGIKEMEELDGSVWLRKEFVIDTPMDASLSLGPIDDSDQTFVNGVLVGKTYNAYNIDRHYDVKGSILKKGKNVLVVRVEDYVGGGGIYDDDKLYLTIGDKKIPLDGKWKYKIGMVIKEPMPAVIFGPNVYPSCLYNGMIAPITDFPVKGVIWYQGESDTYRSQDYRTLFPNLITDWRNHWNQKEMPFLYVQLANFKTPQDIPGPSIWAELREAQSLALSLPHTAMITAIDIGEAGNIHPTNKQEVGRRLANAALSEVYGIPKKYRGPTYKSHKKCGKAFEITFDYVGQGLKVDDKFGYVYGFTIAGEDKKFHWAKAEIISPNTVKVYADDVKKPVAVRYSWQANPDPANLKNSDGLPAFPFRTDVWKYSTYKIKRF